MPEIELKPMAPWNSYRTPWPPGIEQRDQQPGGDDRAQHAEQLGAADPLDLAAQPDRLHGPEQRQQREDQELDRGPEVEAAGLVAVLLGGGDHAGVVEPGQLLEVGLEGRPAPSSMTATSTRVPATARANRTFWTEN